MTVLVHAQHGVMILPGENDKVEDLGYGSGLNGIHMPLKACV